MNCVYFNLNNVLNVNLCDDFAMILLFLRHKGASSSLGSATAPTIAPMAAMKSIAPTQRPRLSQRRVAFALTMNSPAGEMGDKLDRVFWRLDFHSFFRLVWDGRILFSLGCSYEC